MSAPLRFTASGYFSLPGASVSDLKISNPGERTPVSSRDGVMLDVAVVDPGTGTADCTAVRDRCIASFKQEYESVVREYDKAKLADERKKKCLSVLGSVAKWIGIGVATVATGGIFGIWYGKRQKAAVQRDLAKSETIDNEILAEAGPSVEGNESLAQKKDEIAKGVDDLANQTDAKELNKGFQNLAKKVEGFCLGVKTEMLELKAGFSASAMNNLSKVKKACRSFVDCKDNVPGTDTTYLQKAVNAFKEKFKDDPWIMRKIDEYVASSGGVLSEKIINAIVRSKGAKAMLQDVSFGKGKGNRDVESLIGYGLSEVLNEVVKRGEDEVSSFVEEAFLKNFGRKPNQKNANDRIALGLFRLLYSLKTEPSFDLKLQPGQKGQFRLALKKQFTDTASRTENQMASDLSRGTTVEGGDLLHDNDPRIPEQHKPILRGFVTQQVFSLFENRDFQKSMGLQGWVLGFNSLGNSLGKIQFQKCQGKNNAYQFSYDYKTPVTSMTTNIMGTNYVYAYIPGESEPAGDDKPMATLKFGLTVELDESGRIKDVTIGKDAQMSVVNLGAAHGTTDANYVGN